jgi:DUF4097 and DUF4098 domain-containing protein YvlB
MTEFATPAPIEATVELIVGDLRVVATDRTDTVVQVDPSDPTAEADRRTAEQTRVDYADGRLLVKTPKQRGRGVFSKPGSIDVTLELPAGSRLRVSSAVGKFRSTGVLAECRVKNSAGDVQVDRAGVLEVETSAGRIEADSVEGRADVSTGTGKVRIREVGGPAVVKNSNGDTWIGAVGGDLRANAANGDVVVDRADAGVVASTARGDIRVGELVRGSASMKTSYGEIELGIRAGTAARLDVSTSYGRVRNQLEVSDGPQAGDEMLRVQARSSFGDIVIHRATAGAR